MADLHDIARAMVALPGWRWRGGMLTDTGIRVVGVGRHNGQPFILGHVVGNLALDRYYTDPPLFTPDLTDPATLGAIEHGLLAPAGVWIWRSPTVLIDGRPAVMAVLGMRSCGPPRATLAEALVDGLGAVT